MDTYRKNRCNWCLKDPIYVDYHDSEWGVPIYDDRKIFESLFLETFQSGLSWITILKKRKNNYGKSSVERTICRGKLD